jgi:hypothetical protein
MYSSILDEVGATESDLFEIPSEVLYRGKEIIKLSEDGYVEYKLKDIWGWVTESEANFFRCFSNCCAVMAVL